jgi:hypothetical protein
VVLYRFGLEDYISTDGEERRILGKPITAFYGFSASLKSPHLIVEPLVS